jgi:hypothetical protein
LKPSSTTLAPAERGGETVAAPFHGNGRDSNGDDIAAPALSTEGTPRVLPDGELDRRIKAGWEEWSELLDGLVSTGGMLPSRELVGHPITGGMAARICAVLLGCAIRAI